MDKINLPRTEIAKNFLYTVGAAFAALSFFVAILWFFDRSFWILNASNYEPATVILTGISAGCFAIGKSLIWMVARIATPNISFTKEQSLRHRQAMLALVKNTWIDGYLKNSLHNEVIIQLGLKEKKAAVNRPFDMLLKTVDKPDEKLPPDKSLIDVFQEKNQSLLILGAPGSGKTTMLLELTRELLLQAEADVKIPIPVVFNLSSWKGLGQPFPEWIVAELISNYRIPEKIAKSWVENDELLLLLDGLDEVAAEYREACAQTINAFRQDHLVPLVVCSRIADYESLNTKLKLHSAVVLQPITSEQIEKYLTTISPKLEAVRISLEKDPGLQELAEIPLMLSIITLAYHNISTKEINVAGLQETRRHHLLNTYIQRMLAYRSNRNDKPFSPEKTIRWLKWITQKMMQNSQTIFLIEEIRAKWLLTSHQVWIYYIISGLIIGFFFGLVSLPFGGLPLGLAAVMAVQVLIYMYKTHMNKIKLVESIEWSWGMFFNAISDSPGMLPFTLLVSLIVIIFTDSTPYDVLYTFLLVWVGGTLLDSLERGLVPNIIKAKTSPNQGLQLSIKNALLIGIIGGGTLGMIGWGIVILLMGKEYFILGLWAGLNLGLYYAIFIYGGLPAIKHLTLRFIFAANGDLPWNLVRFLNYATERIFLRRVGGGYIFIHRMIMEHFANLTDEDIEKLASPK